MNSVDVFIQSCRVCGLTAANLRRVKKMLPSDWKMNEKRFDINKTDNIERQRIQADNDIDTVSPLGLVVFSSGRAYLLDFISEEDVTRELSVI